MVAELIQTLWCTHLGYSGVLGSASGEPSGFIIPAMLAAATAIC
jgi:hypothetical protein